MDAGLNRNLGFDVLKPEGLSPSSATHLTGKFTSPRRSMMLERILDSSVLVDTVAIQSSSNKFPGF